MKRACPVAPSSIVRLVSALAIALVAASGSAQQTQQAGTERPGSLAVTLPIGPVVYHTADGVRVRVVILTRGLSHPWGLAFLPEGRMLVTERAGRLRVIDRDGRLDPRPVPGVPGVLTGVNLAGLMDIAVHPRYAENRWVYLTYSKPAERNGQRGAHVALARGRFDGTTLSEVRDLLVTSGWGLGIAASRILFGADGMLYMTVGGAINANDDVGGYGGTGMHAQEPGHHFGKLLRLRDDGSAAPGNPFIGRADYLPEIYSLGHRNQLGLAFHPETGALWASENAPLGGDEVNVILPGRNYGWPIISYGREYNGARVSTQPWREGMEPPEIVWLPSIARPG